MQHQRAQVAKTHVLLLAESLVGCKAIGVSQQRQSALMKSMPQSQPDITRLHVWFGAVHVGPRFTPSCTSNTAVMV